MERGDAWPRFAHRSLHGGVVRIVVLTLRCNCGFLRGNGGGWRRVLARGGTMGSCLLFFLFLPFCEGVHLFFVSVIGKTDRQRESNKMKKGDNEAVLWPIARCVAARAVGLDCFTDRRCSVAAWRTDLPAVRVPRPTPLGLRNETDTSVLWSQRHLLAAVGRCEWDASPHGCCDGTSPWLL
ncbi:retrotransposon hot spot (RHS) protein [Trypanosoma cruzi]|nr:retrotransposon hot spot (RHS) protein [Trypanosoma cruzi]